MAIIPKSVAEERRRLRAEAAQAGVTLPMPPETAPAVQEPKVRKFVKRRVVQAGAPETVVDSTPPEQTPEPRKVGRGHPPVEHQFKKGNKGGPGRPKGSKNHDTKLKERFETKRTVKINGVEQVATQHDILVDLRFKQALEGKDKAHQYLLGEAARLYPANDETTHAVGPARALTRGEEALLQQLLSDMNLPAMIPAALPQTVTLLNAPSGERVDQEADDEEEDEA